MAKQRRKLVLTPDFNNYQAQGVFLDFYPIETPCPTGL